MTDRHCGYIVTLEKDMREDDAQATIEALKWIKGVASVEPIVSTPDIQVAIARAKSDIEMKIYEVLR